MRGVSGSPCMMHPITSFLHHCMRNAKGSVLPVWQDPVGLVSRRGFSPCASFLIRNPHGAGIPNFKCESFFSFPMYFLYIKSHLHHRAFHVSFLKPSWVRDAILHQNYLVGVEKGDFPSWAGCWTSSSTRLGFLGNPVDQRSRVCFGFGVLALQSKKNKLRNGLAQYGQQSYPNLDYFTERHPSA